VHRQVKQGKSKKAQEKGIAWPENMCAETSTGISGEAFGLGHVPEPIKEKA